MARGARTSITIRLPNDDVAPNSPAASPRSNAGGRVGGTGRRVTVPREFRNPTPQRTFARSLAFIPVEQPRSASQSAHLFATLYEELHRLAGAHLRRSGGDLTLSTTTVLHEAWLDISARRPLDFPDRAHFLAYAARAMRAIVIDHARQMRARKRGGGTTPITLRPALAADSDERNVEELSQVSDALDELATLEPTLAELVDLHFFCGYTFAEIAQLRGLSERTIQRDWRKARLLLHDALANERKAPPGD